MDVTDRVAMALACTAIDRRLSGTIFLDLDPALIFSLSRWLTRLVGGKPAVYALGAKLGEEMLWEKITVNPLHGGDRESVEVRWDPGPLAGFRRPPGIVLVPDLALLSLPAARAAVTLIDAEVAHLERSGVSQSWRPLDRWLGSLRRADVGRVSPHLLDRFAVRVDANDLEPSRDSGPVLPDPPPEWTQAVLAVRRGADLPALSDAAVDEVVALHWRRAPGVRRDLSLGRLARALAALARDPEVLPGHVATAAELTGLAAAGGPRGSRRRGAGWAMPVGWDRGDREHGRDEGYQPAESTTVPLHRAPLHAVPTGQAPAADSPGAPGRPQVTAGPERTGGIPGQLAVVSGPPAALPPEPVNDALATSGGDAPPESGAPAPHGPYPEDEAPPRRDPAALRLGWQRALAAQQRGHPIGTQPARGKWDIAVAATLLHAARYQRQRCREHYRGCRRLHIYCSDLRSYRRAPQPRPLLLLLLDHTCRTPDWNWYRQLAPYLRAAYVSRSLIGVIEVGARADTVDGELRATQFRPRSLLDPRVAAALRRPRGRATPLAHGLSLASGMLRHDLQQGGGLVSEATLLVVTDGRANVPLAASRTGRPPAGVVGGIAVSEAEDAAGVILMLHRMSRVTSVVIHPGRRSSEAHLAARLAAALGATIVHGTPASAAGQRDGAV